MNASISHHAILNKTSHLRSIGWEPAKKRKFPAKHGCVAHRYLKTHQTSWKISDFEKFFEEREASMIKAIKQSFLFTMIVSGKNPTKELNPRTNCPWIAVQSEVFENAVLEKISQLRIKYISIDSRDLDIEEIYLDFIFLQNIICMKIEYQEPQYKELHQIYWDKFYPHIEKKGTLYKFSSHSHFLMQKMGVRRK